jgi:phosphoribosyl 1,2-cyclic phosphodiesterase
MQVRFWGVRGSLPAPATTAGLRSCLLGTLQQFARDENRPSPDDAVAMEQWLDALPAPLRSLAGGNTPCVEMRTDSGDLFIMDAGTGIRGLGLQLVTEAFGNGRGHAHVFFSHYHWDHLQGWPFFSPIYLKGNRFDLYARHEKLKEHLKHQQQAPYFPPAAWDDIKSEINYHQLGPEPVVLCGGRVKVSSISLDHPSGSFAYRFEADGKVFIYASDGAYNDLDEDTIRPYLEFYRDADLLIFDAQFTYSETYEKRTWGHSSAVVGVELANQSNTKRLALFHHDPNTSEEQLDHLVNVARDYVIGLGGVDATCEVLVAREGDVIHL